MRHFPEGHVHASLLKQTHRAQQRQPTQPLSTAKFCVPPSANVYLIFSTDGKTHDFTE